MSLGVFLGAYYIPVCLCCRLTILTLMSLGVFLGTYYIPVCFGTVVLSAACGYVLSIDLASLGNQLLALCRSKNKVNTSQFLRDSRQSQHNVGFGWTWGLSTWIYHIVMLAVACSVAAATNYNHAHIDSKYLGWCIVGICVVEKVSRDVQSVYVVCGLMRNYFFPHSCHHSNRAFLKAKGKLGIVGMFRRVLFHLGKL